MMTVEQEKYLRSFVRLLGSLNILTDEMEVDLIVDLLWPDWYKGEGAETAEFPP